MNQLIDSFDIPILPGEDLEIHVGRSYIVFTDGYPNRSIKADDGAAVYVEDWV